MKTLTTAPGARTRLFWEDEVRPLLEEEYTALFLAHLNSLLLPSTAKRAAAALLQGYIIAAEAARCCKGAHEYKGLDRESASTEQESKLDDSIAQARALVEHLQEVTKVELRVEALDSVGSAPDLVLLIDGRVEALIEVKAGAAINKVWDCKNHRRDDRNRDRDKEWECQLCQYSEDWHDRNRKSAGWVVWEGHKGDETGPLHIFLCREKPRGTKNWSVPWRLMGRGRWIQVTFSAWAHNIIDTQGAQGAPELNVLVKTLTEDVVVAEAVTAPEQRALRCAVLAGPDQLEHRRSHAAVLREFTFAARQALGRLEDEALCGWERYEGGLSKFYQGSGADAVYTGVFQQTLSRARTRTQTGTVLLPPAYVLSQSKCRVESICARLPDVPKLGIRNPGNLELRWLNAAEGKEWWVLWFLPISNQSGAGVGQDLLCGEAKEEYWAIKECVTNVFKVVFAAAPPKKGEC